ncbi:hypothetical protein [Nocardioides terrisoli]|uniref:hypothetical protein n=1 Tax=Nocardioides terrisoli TaxID=3388267 RepID=UPI00287BA242|nr:hypothetical protein [Nocardioides marmorisolisilvae]
MNVTVKHPSLPVAYSVPEGDVARWEASGWLVPCSDGTQEHPGFVAEHAAAPCPTCGASGDEPCRTASGNPTSRHKARG